MMDRDEEILKEIQEFVGEGFSVSIRRDFSDFSHVVLKIPVEGMQATAEDLRKSVVEAFSKSKVASLHQWDLDNMRKEMNEKENELRSYKNYYEMEFELRNGKKRGL